MSEVICERSWASAVARLRSATAWRYWTKAVAYRFATRAACDGTSLVAVMAITLVWPTSAADTAGALFSWARTACWTGALVTSCNSVSTSVWVTGCGCVTPTPLASMDGCTSSCAVAEYCLCAVSENARLAARPSAAANPTHHLRRRRICRYARNDGSVPNSVIMTFSLIRKWQWPEPHRPLREVSVRQAPGR